MALKSPLRGTVIRKYYFLFLQLYLLKTSLGQFVTVVYVSYIQYSKIPFKLHIVPYPTDSPSWSVCDSSIRKLYTVQ